MVDRRNWLELNKKNFKLAGTVLRITNEYWEAANVHCFQKWMLSWLVSSLVLEILLK